MFLFHKKSYKKNEELIDINKNKTDIEVKPKDMVKECDKPIINNNKIEKTSEKSNPYLYELIERFCDRDIFISNVKKYVDEELREEISSMIDFDQLYYLFYGDIPSYCKNISKVDYNKDCKTFKVLITDVTDLRRSIRFLRRLIRYFDSFLFDFNENFRKMYIDGLKEDDKNYGIIKRLETMLDSFSTDTAYCFNVASNLLYSLDTYYNENPNSIGKKITFTKHDTLKRYYFVHTYSLKGAVKIFNNDTMIFGEVNNLMKQYDFLYDFVFGTIICNIQTMKTIFSNIKY